MISAGSSVPSLFDIAGRTAARGVAIERPSHRIVARGRSRRAIGLRDRDHRPGEPGQVARIARFATARIGRRQSATRARDQPGSLRDGRRRRSGLLEGSRSGHRAVRRLRVRPRHGPDGAPGSAATSATHPGCRRPGAPARGPESAVRDRQARGGPPFRTRPPFRRAGRRADDFNGRYTLVSNGQTSGSLELVVAADGAVSGRFRSDRNGSVYPSPGESPPT